MTEQKNVTPVTARAVKTKLRATGINKTFKRDGTETSVLENVELEVAQGEFLCLLGPSGCGKSTLLNICAGFLSPSTGTVTIDDEPVTGPDPRRIGHAQRARIDVGRTRVGVCTTKRYCNRGSFV